jgi:uncharacterized membrane protein YjfL (UPF0719 family)
MALALRYILLGMVIATALHFWLQPSVGILVFVFWAGNALGVLTMMLHFAVDRILEKSNEL